MDEFLARSRLARCGSYREVAERIARQGFSMFLNTAASVTDWNADGTECTLVRGVAGHVRALQRRAMRHADAISRRPLIQVLEDNPLTDFVELPEQLSRLSYSNLLCGVIRGALEMVNMDVRCVISKDSLRGADCTELRLTFVSAAPEAYPFKDDD